MAIVHRNFMAIFTNGAVFPLGFDGIRPFSVAGRRVFVYDRGERRITLQEDTPMKIMAIDYGDAHTGVAISDRTLTLTGFSTVITAYRPEAVIEKLLPLISEHEISELVLGHPLNMDGTRGPRAEKAEGFAEMLREATSLPVTLWDERRTTVDAHNILLNNGKRAKERKKTVDAVAASLMLEGYLTFKKRQG